MPFCPLRCPPPPDGQQGPQRPGRPQEAQAPKAKGGTHHWDSRHWHWGSRGCNSSWGSGAEEGREKGEGGREGTHVHVLLVHTRLI
jgi:hypothetical protein